MQRLAKLVCVLALATAATPAAEPASPENAGLSPIYSRSRRFSIPFSVETAPAAVQTVEVQLYVSTDGGHNWTKYAAVKPEAKSFRFQASSDGPYWFLVRTKDSTGHIHPPQPSQPELYVIVDTAKPVLWLEANADQAGTVHVRWRARDQHLDPASFRLEYAAAGTTRWQPVAAAYAAGQATFVPREEGPLTVRAEIADQAQNITARSSDVLGRPAAQAKQASGNRRPTSASAPQDAPGSSSAANQGSGNDNGWRPATAGGDAPTDPLVQQTDPPSAPPAMPARFPSDAPAVARRPQGERRHLSGTSPSPVEPPLARPAAPGSAGVEDVPDSTESAPQPEPRMVNSRRFALEYELESVGPSGVARVELWQTTDGGKSWSLYGLDEDLTSPMLVTVDGEGTYGFIMVVESGAGLRGPQPQPGDLPEMNVGVDLTPPLARLLSVRQQGASQGSELIIEWEASDLRLAARPITLLAADKPGGPWSIVRANLENTGRFAWRPDGELPAELYLRLEVRDEAGNRRTVDTREPVQIERVQPKSRIQQVRPLEGASRGPRIYRFR